MSDNPDVSLYFETGKTRDGLPNLHCVRGTSALEGYHKHIRRLFKGMNVSPELGVALLREFNFKVSHHALVRAHL